MRKQAKFVTKEMIEKAREMDLYTYMEIYEKDNLVRVCAGTYSLREHDSVKISNGLWVQKSTGIGGRSALDYLVKVRGIPFQEAVEQLSGISAPEPVKVQNFPKKERQVFKLPPKNSTYNRVISYLESRGIDSEIIMELIGRGLLYEAAIHHNAVFVGMSYATGQPAYAFQRGCGTSFRGDVGGSDKRCAFRLENRDSDSVHVFEAPIDALSYATLLKRWGKDWRRENLLSECGVAIVKDGGLLPALNEYIQQRKPRKVILHYDNDKVGRGAAANVKAAILEPMICEDSPPPCGKDVNEYLMQSLRISDIHDMS